ncbi:MAG: ABC transporter ATP-binding protein [Marinoscillum sp.]
MSDIAVRVEGLGKKYLIGKQRHATIGERFRSIWAKSDHVDESEFWALKDVSFEIKKGEAVGIIGKNGAGKSTLLKVLSKITHPTTGRFEMEGRVSSLLEVGTGFHPELTGRENIFLNGTILGMSRSEIKSKFDEIVAFSGVEKFIDTPVKHYSSGMYVRLAFSVAAHLEPEILIIDEVLAVGDAEFQKKCLGKMDEVAKQGRTVIFVSHNIGAVRNLCSEGLLIEEGELSLKANVDNIISKYQNNFKIDRNQRVDFSSRIGKGDIRVNQIEIFDKKNKLTGKVYVGSDLEIKLGISIEEKVTYKSRVIVGIYDHIGVSCARFDSDVSGDSIDIVRDCSLKCQTQPIYLSPGNYSINIALYGNGVMQDYISNVVSLEVKNDDFFETGKFFEDNMTRIWLRNQWSIEDEVQG